MAQEIDIQLFPTGKIFDVGIAADGDFSTIEGLDTAITMSIYCERRADESEVPESTNRRGWWGNQFADKFGFEIGSKLWLYRQTRLTQETIEALRDAAIRGLDWLIDNDIAINIDAVVSFAEGRVILLVLLTRPNGQVERRYFELWENTPT